LWNLWRENITERHLDGIEICNYLQKNLVLYIAVFVVKNVCRVFSNFCRVFSKIPVLLVQRKPSKWLQSMIPFFR